MLRMCLWTCCFDRKLWTYKSSYYNIYIIFSYMLNKTVHSDKTNSTSVVWKERGKKKHKEVIIKTKNNSPSKKSVPNYTAPPISKKIQAIINKSTT